MVYMWVETLVVILLILKLYHCPFYLKYIENQLCDALIFIIFLHCLTSTKFLKEAIDTVGPSILLIIKSSLENDIFPLTLNRLCFNLLLKKPSLDSSVKPDLTWPDPS